jgi:hypothetical protein
LADLLKGYKPPAKEPEQKEEEPENPDQAEPTTTNESPAEYTQDVMNPEGAPVPEELVQPE